MSENKIYGKFEYHNKQYPFLLEGQRVTIIQIPFEFNEDFSTVNKIDEIRGITNKNKYITFVDCTFLGGDYREIYSNIIFNIKGYILTDGADDNFDSLSFSAKALNTFYSPQYAIKHEKVDTNNGSTKIEILPKEKYLKKFDSIIDNEKISNQLFVHWNINLKYEESKIGEIYTVFLMQFKLTKNINELAKYYLYMYDFLTFILFRKNHFIKKVTLYRENKEIGKAIFFQKEENLKYDLFKSICFEDIGIEYIGLLFSKVAEKRIKNELNPFFTPEDDKEYNSIDSVRWLSTALSFEGEFGKKYSDFKAKQSSFFKSTKDELLSKIKELTSENNNFYEVEALYQMINKSDTSIREKFQLMIDKYDEIISDIKNSHLRKLNISEDKKLAKRYADYRNAIAHGTIIQIEEIDIINLVLARIFIYILILEESNIPPNKIKHIINKLFK